MYAPPSRAFLGSEPIPSVTKIRSLLSWQLCVAPVLPWSVFASFVLDVWDNGRKAGLSKR